MAEKLTRTQKAKINQAHRDLLQPMVKHNQDIAQFGEPYVNLKNAIEMEQLGIIDLQTLNEIADMLLVAEKIRIQKKALQKARIVIEDDAKKRGIDIDSLYKLNELSNPEILDSNFVDTNRLSIGMIVKDYKALCELLSEAATTGDAKKNQMKNWKRYFDYEKIKHSNSYIILDIYAEPLGESDIEKSKNYRNSLFVNELKVLILHEISKNQASEKGNIVYYTSYSRLIKRLNIINRFFFEETAKFFLVNFDGVFNTDNIKWNYQVFRSIAFRKIKDSITYALTALKRDNMISVKEYNVIGISYKDEKGNVKYNYHKANDDEQGYIDAAKKSIANSLGYRNSRDACFYKNNEYQKRLKQFYKSNYGWDIVYYQIKIIANEDNLKKHINEYTALKDNKSVADLIPEQVTEYRLKYNRTMVSELSKNADDKKANKLKSKIKRLRQGNLDLQGMEDDEIINIFHTDMDEDVLIYGGEYPERQKIFIEYLIKLDDEKIKKIHNFIKEMQKNQSDELETPILEIDNFD